MNNDLNRLLPLAIGFGMAAIGAALLATKPTPLALPDAEEDKRTSKSDSKVAQLAEEGRNAITRALPDNASTVVGRPMIMAGAAMIMVGLLDEIAGRGGSK